MKYNCLLSLLAQIQSGQEGIHRKVLFSAVLGVKGCYNAVTVFANSRFRAGFETLF